MREDELLRHLVQINGHQAWAVIADQLNKMSSAAGRTGKQCRERWRNHLNPEVKKYDNLGRIASRDPWEEAEDMVLLEAHIKAGNKWKDIAKFLPGRSENSIKNRYNTLSKRYRDRTSKTTLGDVNQALQAVTGAKKDDSAWAEKLIREIGGRIGTTLSSTRLELAKGGTEEKKESPSPAV